MKIGVIIVTLNAKALLAPCLGGLREAGEQHIYLVDNGSTDGSADYVAEHYPEVDLIRLPLNAGFAGGNNVGIRRALDDGCDAVFLLNADTIIDEPFTPVCAQVFAAHTEVGICGPVVVEADAPETIQCAGGRVNTWLSTFPYSRRGEPYERSERIDDVGWVLGAAMAVRREVLDEVGVLDIEYTPIYVEEVDLCYRSTLAGYRNVVTYGTRIRHIGQHSAKVADSEIRRMLGNRYMFALKHAGPCRFLTTAAYITTRAAWRKLSGR